MFPVPLPRVNGVTIVLPLLPWLTFTPVPPPNHTDNNHGRRKAEEARGLRPHGGQGHDEAVRSHVF